MVSMIRIFVVLLERYGMDVLQIAIILALFWKLFYNHLKHMTASLKENNNEIKNVKTEVLGLRERISNVEGQLQVRNRIIAKKKKKK